MAEATKPHKCDGCDAGLGDTHTASCATGRGVRPRTMLDVMDGGRIFAVECIPGGLFRVTESCDSIFHVELTGDELRLLAGELVALADPA